MAEAGDFSINSTNEDPSVTTTQLQVSVGGKRTVSHRAQG